MDGDHEGDTEGQRGQHRRLSLEEGEELKEELVRVLQQVLI